MKEHDMAEKNTRILILGGGYGGIEAAKKLAKRYKKRDDVSITLIDKNPYHTLMTELHEVAAHRVEPDSVRVPFAKVFGASKVKVVLDKITGIDFAAKKAVSATATYEYDYLVIGAGAEPEFFGVPGIKENSFTLWSFADAMKIRHHIEDTFEKAVAEKDQAKRARMLTFVVAGAGFTGIELAGELIEWRDSMCAKWLVDPAEVKVMVVEALPNILPILEEDPRAKVEHLHAQARRRAQDQHADHRRRARGGQTQGRLDHRDRNLHWTCGVQGAISSACTTLPRAAGGNRDWRRSRRPRLRGLADCKFKKEHRDVSGKKGRILVTEDMRYRRLPERLPRWRQQLVP
jgi:NADH dehydrogenase